MLEKQLENATKMLGNGRKCSEMLENARKSLKKAKTACTHTEEQEWRSGGLGEKGNGGMGEWGSGRVGEWGSRGVRERGSGEVGE